MAFRTNKMPVLQEKSASGSVATFNTALAMPLPSCNIAVNAWQEGSGDPSPSNVRAIHGFSEVNATRAGYNLFDYDNTYIRNSRIINYSTGNADIWGSGWYSTIDYVPIMPNVNYELYSTTKFVNGGTAGVAFYDKNYQFISGRQYYNGFVGNSLIFTTPRNAYYMRFCGANDLSQVSLSVAKQSKYEPYITPTIYTIQLGQEVYGAEVDVVNGKLYITTQYILLTENDTFVSYTFSGKNGVRCTKLTENGNRNNGKCSHTVINGSGSDYMWLGVSDKRIYWVGILDTLGLSDVNQFYSWIANNHVEVAVEYDTPLQIIDLSDIPTLSTLIGNNTIFADTGDIDLTYKDLDIAKRGNFREVFRLPS